MALAEQLLLNLRPRADVFLSDFQGEAYGPMLLALEQLLAGAGHSCYLYGPPGAGKQAWLAALSHEAERRGITAISLHLDEMLSLSPEVLQGLEGFNLLALAGLEAIAGRAEWEEGLFHLINRLYASGTSWVVTADLPVQELSIALPDLRSRLRQAPAFALALPEDSHREQVLAAVAARRGLSLEEEVQRYVLERGPRPMGEFLACIERLDRESLLAKRRLTVPFVRDVLGKKPDGEA